MELTLATDADNNSNSTTTKTIKGLIYCTDEISQSIVIQRSLIHTTLSSEIIIIHAPSVKESKSIPLPPPTTTDSSTDGENIRSGEDTINKYGVANLEELKKNITMPMNVSRRALEERERRALRLAEESLSHVNQKVW